MLLLIASTIAFPFCRCSQQPLQTYFERADIVILARISKVHPVNSGMVAVDVTYILKPDQPLKGSLDGVTLATPETSAGCGLPVKSGADFVIFASLASPANVAWFDTCSGTRAYPVGLPGSPSFPGTPDNMVVRELFDLAAGKADTTSRHALPWIGGLRSLKSAPVNHPARAAMQAFRRAVPRSAAYLDADWDGRVFLAAGGRQYRLSRLRSAPGRSEYTIDLHERRLIGSAWWLRVSIYEESPCTVPDARPTHGGWIPAFSSRGRFVADIWPGGC